MCSAVHFYHLRHVSKIWPETESWKGQWFVNYITWILTGMNLQKFPSDFHRFPGPRDHRDPRPAFSLQQISYSALAIFLLNGVRWEAGILGKGQTKNRGPAKKGATTKKNIEQLNNLWWPAFQHWSLLFDLGFFLYLYVKISGKHHESEHIWRKNTNLPAELSSCESHLKTGDFSARWEHF